MSGIQRPVLIRADRVRDACGRFAGVTALAISAAVVAFGGCGATGATLRSNHFRLSVPPDWQVVEAGGGETPVVVRAPSEGAAPGVDMRVYAWLVGAPPADAAGDALERLAGLASARADDDPPCPDRATQFFVFGRPARAIHLVDAGGGHIVVTAGESDGSLVALVGSRAAGAPGCEASRRMDAIIERLAASLSGTGDLTRPREPESVGPGSARAPSLRFPEP